MSTPFDPVNDRIDVYSAALGQVAEVPGKTLVERSLAAGAGGGPFVPIAGGNMEGPLGAEKGFFTGYQIIAPNEAIIDDMAGRFIIIEGTVAGQSSIPAASKGFAFTVWNNTSHTQVVDPISGSVITPGISSTATLSIPPLALVLLASDGSNYCMISHSDVFLGSPISLGMSGNLPVSNSVDTVINNLVGNGNSDMNVAAGAVTVFNKGVYTISLSINGVVSASQQTPLGVTGGIMLNGGAVARGNSSTVLLTSGTSAPLYAATSWTQLLEANTAITFFGNLGCLSGFSSAAITGLAASIYRIK